MNILIPDSWLREFLVTKASPEQIKEYLSLCGPSVERIHTENGEVIYDIEVTSNRPDSMSILGIAREAAAILSRFGIKAKLVNDPYVIKSRKQKTEIRSVKKLNIKTDPQLNPRWTSVVIDNVKVGPSPAWLRKRLEATGIRSLNTVVDITNYIMRAYGQPVHAFDYDAVLPRNGIPTMILRASKKGERLTTLDGKTHTLPGDDIVIEDGSGRLIDLCGIMGAQNSSIKNTTKTIVLFMQTYDPVRIRKTSMSLAHRTEAAGLFEKGLDPELVYPSILIGIDLMSQVAAGSEASPIYDLYAKPYKPYTVGVTREKLTTYLGTSLPDKEIVHILSLLGFTTKLTKNSVSVLVPSFRKDVTIDVDIIEEVARIYGYHNIKPKQPSTEPPVVIADPTFSWEEEVKVRLRDWGFTETYTYSMISEELIDTFRLDKKKAYKISNPLSSEWVYMRPSLLPSMLSAIKQNLNFKSELKLFELSMIYEYQQENLPNEKPVLLVAWSGNKYYEVKGIAEALLSLFGIPLPSLASYASLKLVEDVTILEMDFVKMVKNAKPTKVYKPIPKYPPSYEDLALIIPPETPIGPLIETLKKVNPLVANVTLLDSYENIRTLHVTYLSPEKNLITEDIRPIREKLLKIAEQKFGAILKTT